MRSDRAPLWLKVTAGAGLLFLHLPILLIFVYAFSAEDSSFTWPPPGLTLRWFGAAWERPDIWAALERVPPSLVEASADLGASPGRTFRHVIWPLALPGVVAGSIFTFSLTLGDYIIPQIIGTSARFIGLAVYQYQGTAGNIPLAAAFAVVPIVIMGLYLLAARRMGAFDAL